MALGLIGGILQIGGASAQGAATGLAIEKAKKSVKHDFARNSALIMEAAFEEASFLGKQNDRAQSVIRQQAGASGFTQSSFAPVANELTELTIEEQSLIISGAMKDVDLLRRQRRSQLKQLNQQHIQTAVGTAFGSSSSGVQAFQ